MSGVREGGSSDPFYASADNGLRNPKSLGRAVVPKRAVVTAVLGPCSLLELREPEIPDLSGLAKACAICPVCPRATSERDSVPGARKKGHLSLGTNCHRLGRYQVCLHLRQLAFSAEAVERGTLSLSLAFRAEPAPAPEVLSGSFAWPLHVVVKARVQRRPSANRYAVSAGHSSTAPFWALRAASPAWRSRAQPATQRDLLLNQQIVFFRTCSIFAAVGNSGSRR